jgi:hypothetical protein
MPSPPSHRWERIELLRPSNRFQALGPNVGGRHQHTEGQLTYRDHRDGDLLGRITA